MSITVWDYGATPALDQIAGTRVQVVAGGMITTGEEFLNDAGDPTEPLAGFPQVRLMEGPHLVTSGFGYQKQQGYGQWLCDLAIPIDMEFDGASEKVLTIVWEWRDQEGTQKSSLHVSVLPESAAEEQSSNELVLMCPFNGVEVKVPYVLNQAAGDKAVLTVYDGNTVVNTAHMSTAQQHGSYSVLTFGLAKNTASLVPYNLIIDLTIQNTKRQVFVQLYMTNPSILSAMQALDLAINKANQVEAIPGLRYRDIDLLQGLIRGLDHFNSLPPAASSFTGENMMGPIRESWLVCASIKVLRAQLQAEGWFNFDFTGQNTSLNVDRTPSIESALSAYEGLVDSMIKPLKIMLGKKGVIDGDGSQGRELSRYSSMGVTALSNTTITRSRVGGGTNRRW